MVETNTVLVDNSELGLEERIGQTRGPTLIDKTGNSKLIETLSSWGTNLFAGVNGGGIIHLAKHLEPFEGLHQANDERPRLLDIPESTATNIPLGYYMASGKIAASVSTTGGASLYGLLGLSNAKLHEIPGIWIMAANAITSYGKGPLQDMTSDGLNSIEITKSILGENCLLIDDIRKLEAVLYKAQEILHKSKPVALMFHPDILSKEAYDFKISWQEKKRKVNRKDLEIFLREFPEEIKGKRVVIYAGEEAARYKNIRELTTKLTELLKAPIVYSMNGVSAVSSSNRYSYGYIYLGFNDKTKELWESLNKEDIVLSLGFDPGEYELNMQNIPANVCHLTNFENPYGSRNDSFQHRVEGRYRKVKGDIGLILKELIQKLEQLIKYRPDFEVPENLNTRQIEKPNSKYVDLVKFYKEFARLVKPETFIVNDVSQAYKDFQYVTQRPIPGVFIFSPHRVSTMGDSLGVGIGAKIGNPNLHVNIFAGDGCFKYFEGALSNVANLGLTLWILDNNGYHIVGKGLERVMPHIEKKRYHSFYSHRTDFAKVAEAHGWESYRLKQDLSNLEDLMERSYSRERRNSMLVHIPVDLNIEVGINPRLLNLRKQGIQTYL